MAASTIVLFVVLVLVIVILNRKRGQGSPQAGSSAQPHRKPSTFTDLSAKQWLAALPEKLEPYRLPRIRITPIAEAPSQPWQSRFGGNPYWPQGVPYPSTEEGAPLQLLAQLNLNEMPSLAGYPDSGILQFFIANDDLMGLRFASRGEDPVAIATDPRGFRVVYHPEVIEEPDRLETISIPEETEHYLPVHGCYSLRFAADSALPAPTDHRFAAIAGDDLAELPDELWDNLYDTYNAEGCHLGGYATFTQDDPRHDQTPGDWLLLLQIDTTYSDGVDIMWGDSGVGNFFIHKDDLARQDFSRVWYNWDCC